MRVLITGISGFIGCYLARELTAAGFALQGLAKEPERCDPAVEVFDTDLLDLIGLVKIVERCTPEVIVHLAGLSHVGESWRRPADYYRVNFLGTRNLLRAAAGARVIVASSAEVYGVVPDSEQPIPEHQPLDPRSPYAITKACAEELALDYGAITVRAFNVVGAGQSLTFALPSFAAQLAAIRRGEREPVLRVGDLSPRRDFLHVQDAAAGYRVLIERGEQGIRYNLASGKACSIAEMLDRLRRISGVAAEVEADAARMRPADIPLLQGDARRLRALGWSPRRDVDQALEEIWEEASEARPSPPAGTARIGGEGEER